MKPFTDIIVTDNEYCPVTHPEDVVFEMWLGTRGMCDCFERAGDRSYEIDTLCRRGKNQPHNSPDCYDVGSLSPAVQNRIKSMRYCGKRHDLAFKDMVRPVQVAESGDLLTTNKYACPKGYEPCNQAFFSEPTPSGIDGHDYVICYPEDQTKQLYCPITSVKFQINEIEKQ